MELIDQLILTSKQAIDSGNIAKVLTNETIRKLKGKSSQLYTIFSEKKLDEETKQRIKTQYSSIRAILKKLDQANSQAKL